MNCSNQQELEVFLPIIVDGRKPSIACATTGGKIVIHSPHEETSEDGQQNSLRYLNMNRKITALAAGIVTTISEISMLQFIFTFLRKIGWQSR